MNDQNALEIERRRLQERFDEQPESRVFAPLADCLRKLGHLQEALGICHTGLTKHPRYSSAYVILGKIHLERGDDAAAREAFERVTEFDPQNLLALRQLAEIDESADDWSSAVDRWEQVAALEFDPEKAEQRLEAARARLEGGAAVDFDEEPATTTVQDETMDIPSADAAPEAVEIQDEPVAEAIEAPADEGGEEAEAFEDPEESVAAAEPEPVADAIDGPDTDDVEDFAETDAAETTEAAAETIEAADTPAEAPVEELDAIHDMAEADEPVTTEDEPEFALVEEPAAAPEPVAESPAESFAQDEEIPTTEIATMTLAEIYAEQGFREKALDILRQVLERNPDAEKVARRITELEAAVDASPQAATSALDDVDDAVRDAVDPRPVALSQDRSADVDDDPGAEPTPPLTARTSPEGEEQDERERYGHFKDWLDRIRVDD